MAYVGRFAPSPTGLLHIGSLLAALASYADARAAGGVWLLRMEELDPPREMAGAADLVYPCFCSRKAWQTGARQGADGFVYGGRCRDAALRPSEKAGKTPAWRLRVPDGEIGFADRVVGFYAQNLARDIGDFVLLRADGYWAYQLAVVVDDAAQGITHIVRGQDLLVSTPRQIYLQRCLNAPTPHYAHLPLLTNKLGQKWSKQTRADAIDVNQAAAQLRQVMNYLNIPAAPDTNQPHDLLNWTVANWQMTRVPKSAICTQQQS